MSEPLQCSICQDGFSSPVVLPCGHGFCLGCIGEYWRLHRPYRCPLCRALFPSLPQLKLQQKEGEIKEAAVPLKAGEVSCDVCLSKQRAVRSCVQCLASYCGAHLEPHYQDKELRSHHLINVAKNLEGSICGLHGKQVDRFCRSDQTCICVMCAQTDHRGHNVVSITKEAAKKRTSLKRKKTKLLQAIQERLDHIEKHKNEEQKRRLEEEVLGLEGRSAELEQLVQTEDNLCFLQRFSTLLHLMMIDADVRPPRYMASVPKTRETSSLEKHLICSICMGVFQSPVTTGCGHTFCKQCLCCNFKYNDRVCPLCKQPQHKTPGVNIIMNTLVQQMANPSSDDNIYTGAAGEVACDICTEQKLRAEKSCLVCLVSYCPAHLKNHSSIARLKSHKLVEPVKNLDKRACLKHGRPLELYSKRGEQCICVCCVEGDQEEFISTEKESHEKKAQIDNIKMELQQKVLKRQKQVEEINATLKNCTDQIENEWSDIKSVFKAVIGFLLVAKTKVFQPLKERRQNVESEAKGLTDGLQAEIIRLEKTISELDDICALEDHIFFLQSYPSVNDMVDFKDCCETELDTSLPFGTMRKLTTTLLEEIQKELDKLAATELQRVSRFAVDVKFDPVTAHRSLVVSKGGKEVTYGGEDNMKKDDDLERFDQFGSVLGVNCLTSGKSYWEVEVSNKSGWDLGVARGNASRKGHLVLNPENGYWATVHYEGEKYAALTAPPILLSLKEKPRKVGVFVDYEEGLVSFYDVMAKTHIYSFTQCSFGGKIFPYFSPHAKQNEKNAGPLIISSVKGI